MKGMDFTPFGSACKFAISKFVTIKAPVFFCNGKRVAYMVAMTMGDNQSVELVKSFRADTSDFSFPERKGSMSISFAATCDFPAGVSMITVA